MAQHESQGLSDEWYTPKHVFDALGCFFDMDVAAPVDLTHVCTPAILFIKSDSLNKKWKGFVWCNPPFGGRNSKALWLDKMSDHGNGICLTPDRSSAPWWQKAAKECDALLMISGKIKFLKPDGTLGISPSTGTTLFAYGEKAVIALNHAANNKLGIAFKRIEPCK